MTETYDLMVQLQALVEAWIKAAQERRERADAETNKIWSAEQYGIADTYEDAAMQIQQAIQQMEEDQGPSIDWHRLTDMWLELAQEGSMLADADDNRLTVAYRRAGSETYRNAASQVRALLDEA